MNFGCNILAINAGTLLCFFLNLSAFVAFLTNQHRYEQFPPVVFWRYSFRLNLWSLVSVVWGKCGCAWREKTWWSEAGMDWLGMFIVRFRCSVPWESVDTANDGSFSKQPTATPTQPTHSGWFASAGRLEVCQTLCAVPARRFSPEASSTPEKRFLVRQWLG